MLKKEEKKAGKKIIRMVLDIVCYMILGVLCIFIVYMLVFMFRGMKGNEPPTIFNHQIYIVQSNSMSPTFKTGSLLIVNTVDKQSIKKSDIITFRRNEDSLATTHRVVNILNDEGLLFVTRGDANNVDDPIPVDARDVKGVVVSAIPYLGYLIGFIRTKQGLIVCIVIPALLIILTQVLKLLKEEKKKQRKPTIEELQARVNELLSKDPGQEDNK